MTYCGCYMPHCYIYGSYNSAGSWHNVLLYPQAVKGV